ncbi:hypothetical protein HPB51_012067 [Rhipicephalus microplus]|uniref:G-protein coupled receptors family 2 profile 2 domain-containing protein n=1 Tax=Rhipicephalus microplus TaxID=6941 RepID=A0A9J6EGP3_RHIMP|nr:hypothetical protein HPB51_012067 [Rhipicephalus microplus]
MLSCWLENEALLYSFLLPVAVILAANTFVFWLIVYNIYCRRQTGLRSSQSQVELAKAQLRATICIIFLLGLTWIFAYLSLIQAASQELGHVFEYLFVISSSLQGLVIFIFHNTGAALQSSLDSAMSDGDIRRLCRFFSELTLEDIHSLEIRMFPFLSAVEGMDLLPAVDAVFHRIKAINDEQERLQSMATFYSWLLPRTRRIPWVLYSVHRILSVLDATQIGLTLAQKVRSLDNRAIEGVFDEGSAWCLTILTTQGALSPANYIPPWAHTVQKGACAGVCDACHPSLSSEQLQKGCAGCEAMGTQQTEGRKAACAGVCNACHLSLPSEKLHKE